MGVCCFEMVVINEIGFFLQFMADCNTCHNLPFESVIPFVSNKKVLYKSFI